MSTFETIAVGSLYFVTPDVCQGQKTLEYGSAVGTTYINLGLSL